MKIAFEIAEELPATPEAIYRAWLDAEEHSAMTGGLAQVSDQVGAAFEAWDGYIHGTNLALEPGRRIVQAWRTTEFDETDEDSRLEVLLEPCAQGTRVTIRHNNLPAHGMQYRQGWADAYFVPMRRYFAGLAGLANRNAG